jgi:hypothetical protein
VSHRTFGRAGGGYTTDGGIHWTFPGVLENNVFRSDPVLGSNERGNFFYLSLRETFYDDIWRSTNGAQSWTRLTFGDVTGGDKQWFTIDTTNGMGHGFLYQAWSTGGNNWGGRQFSRSTDEGVTWMSPILSRIRRYGEHSMWLPMASCLLVAQATLAARFGAFAPAMRKTRASHQRLIK